ncbi:MAG: glucose-6-phosphate isomerase [Rhodothalassiaceae bacterium]
MPSLSDSPAWRALRQQAAAMRHVHMRDLFAADPGRAARYSLDAGDLFLDYSKNRVDDETWRRLFAFAREGDLEGWRARMFAGEKINFTEGRAALHVALRDRSGRAFLLDGVDVSRDVRAELARMQSFVARVHDGAWRGATGAPIRHVVNIGIGGSHLGPEAALTALEAYHHPELAVHFVANLDGNDLAAVLESVPAEETLFIVASKTFTTLETMRNARSARDWLQARLGDRTAVARHFIAVSTNEPAVRDFGIDVANMFRFWDWVGGRYSLWSAIGLAVALGIGWRNFERLLDGAHAMDRHFENAPLQENMPVLLGLLDIWYAGHLGAASRAVLPYDQRLDRLVDHLQQLEMESNGKRIDRAGHSVDYATGPVLWGRAGTNGQHAFYQLLHQGTQLVPADFVLVAEPAHDFEAHHPPLLANALAQAEALMAGRDRKHAEQEMIAEGLDPARAAALAPHRSFPGNRPSSLLLLPRLDPFHVGQLVALYEHRVFVEGTLLAINSFDQWGVELGKKLAGDVLPILEEGREDTAHDASTRALVARLRGMAAAPALRIDPAETAAVFFDMDGVLTDTADLHEAAWKRLFDSFLKRHAGKTSGAFRSFTSEDYLRHLSGKSRLDGIRGFLAARSIRIPEGEPGDDPDAETLHGLGQRKQLLFQEELRRRGATVYPDAQACLLRLRRCGLRIAVLSASRHARAVMTATGLDSLVDLLVDGEHAASRDLPGKPAPDLLIEAARLLSLEPGQVVIVDGSAVGVAAASRGGFQRIVGVARHGGRKYLTRAGADLVIRSLDRLDVRARDAS